MNFKPFFVHFNRTVTKRDSSKRRHMPRGFTVYVQPSALDRHVQVQITFCSAADEFSKKQGRELAMAAETQVVNPRELPKFLSDAAQKCGTWSEEHFYLYILKYIV
jgi:hypothetical protein